jgi:hypothetical protein
MELDASLSWLALALTPGLACRLSARLLRKFGSPDRIFHASLTELEGCSLPALVAQAIIKKDSFKRAEKELAAIRNIAGCRLINWTEPGISADPAANLRSAGAVLSARRSANPESSLPQHCRHAPANAIWLAYGGTAGR